MSSIQMSLILPQIFLCIWIVEKNELSKKIRWGMWFIWHPVIWSKRNDRVFNNCVKEVDETVESIKVLSQWSLSCLKIAVFLYYRWCWNPRDCLSR